MNQWQITEPHKNLYRPSCKISRQHLAIHHTWQSNDTCFLCCPHKLSIHHSFFLCLLLFSGEKTCKREFRMSSKVAVTQHSIVQWALAVSQRVLLQHSTRRGALNQPQTVQILKKKIEKKTASSTLNAKISIQLLFIVTTHMHISHPLTFWVLGILDVATHCVPEVLKRMAWFGYRVALLGTGGQASCRGKGQHIGMRVQRGREHLLIGSFHARRSTCTSGSIQTDVTLQNVDTGIAHK